MINILVVGDSFAAKWPFAKLGWVDILSYRHNVTNLAMAGCGEYKILKQLQSVDITKFDLIIVSHTSPSRIHTPTHPIHVEGFHKNCDLLANETNCLDFSDLWKKERGSINHYTINGNRVIYETIAKHINEK